MSKEPNSPKLEISSKENTPIGKHKMLANNIDEGAWFVCNKVWQLLEHPIDESNDFAQRERLADIQVNLYHPKFPHIYISIQLQFVKTIKNKR